MKQLIKVTAVFLAVLGFLFSFSAGAQVQTARPNVNISSKCKGYYEYLPEGYNPSGTTTYPMIVFLPGIGEFGNGSSQLSRIVTEALPKLIQEGTFPKSFTSGGATHRFIIISPQFTSTPIVAANVDTVIQYMLSHYKVNPKRVYLTGLSYGGGLSFAYPGNKNTSYAARIAAIVPIASPMPLPTTSGYDTIYARSRVIAAAQIPVWATHNSGDTPDSAARTNAYINYINQAPAPNPLAKKTIFSVSGHDAWTKTYDVDFRENGYNIYEWMLQYQKGSTPPAASTNKLPTANAGSAKTITLPTNSVTLTGSGADSDGSIATYNWRKIAGPIEGGTVTSSTAATTTVTGLVRGVYTFRLMVGDNLSAKDTNDVKVTVNPAAGTKAIQVNVYGGSSSYSSTAWNNWSVGTTAATNKVSTAFKYVDGAASTVTATLSATTAIKDNGSTYSSNNVSVAPGGVLRHASQHNALRTLTIQGLSTSKKYDLEFYASYKTTTSNSTVFTVNGVAVSVGVNNNYTKKAAFTSIAPNSSGQIVISIDKTGSYNYLNGFTITESAATPTTKYVKTNIYGGTNAYSNTEWNNWNVGTAKATNKSSGTLKYSDGTTSTVAALLSSTEAVSDNGSTYGGTMAPAEVLRYSSNATATRTLTLSGLSTSKTYSVEFYASRAKTGYSSIFTIGTTTVTVNTDNNKTTKASFTNQKANSSGQIVVTIKCGTTTNASPYNYLNGFTLTEANTTTTATEESGVELRPELTLEPEAASGIGVYPNPATGNVMLTVNNSYKGLVQVQVADASGRMYKTFRFAKDAAVLQQSLQIASLSKGVYFITVQSGAARKTVSLSKQ